MQLANIWLVVGDNGNNIPMKRVTPAECLILRKDFGKKVAGGSEIISPLQHVEILKDTVDRTAQNEFRRLANKYGTKKVEAAFPGENPNIPVDFAAANITATKDTEPAKGTLLEVPALTKLHDDGADLVDNSVQVQAQTEGLKQQIADLQRQLANLPASGTPSHKTVHTGLEPLTGEPSSVGMKRAFVPESKPLTQATPTPVVVSPAPIKPTPVVTPVTKSV